jgi:hypothetical protein
VAFVKTLNLGLQLIKTKVTLQTLVLFAPNSQPIKIMVTLQVLISLATNPPSMVSAFGVRKIDQTPSTALQTHP